jgi:hypothetical protein
MFKMTVVGVAAVIRPIGPIGPISQSVDIVASSAGVIWAITIYAVVAAGIGVAIDVCGGRAC